jgi:hypothetical protein
MRHQLNEMKLCWVCEYELAHPGHTVWGEFILSERTADEATIPIRGFGGIRGGANVTQVYQWRGVSREAAS